MVEEKARSLLPRHHFASLSYYIAEYSAKAMTIDAFVAVLLEMLDTYEKVSQLETLFTLRLISNWLPFQHTLVTEIRELVFPEDRTRYDELVYRRERDPYSVDRHRVSSITVRYSLSSTVLLVWLVLSLCLSPPLQRKGDPTRDLPVSFLEDLFYDTDTIYT